MPSLVISPLLATISDLAVALFTVISQKSWHYWSTSIAANQVIE